MFAVLNIYRKLFAIPIFSLFYIFNNFRWTASLRENSGKNLVISAMTGSQKNRLSGLE